MLYNFNLPVFATRFGAVLSIFWHERCSFLKFGKCLFKPELNPLGMTVSGVRQADSNEIEQIYPFR